MINTYDIYLISDSTGETLERIFLAIKAQFKNFKYKTHFYSFTRTENQISKILEVSQKNNNVIVLYTIVDNKLARHLSNECSLKNIPCFGILGDLIISFSKLLDQKALNVPSRQHIMDDEYYKKIEAIQFTMNHDDGNSVDDIEKSDIILLGVSRTSKTPTSIYLANRGYKVANVPIVQNKEIPKYLIESAKKTFVVGLVCDANRLLDVRRNRIQSMHEDRPNSYTNEKEVLKELDNSKKIFKKYNWPSIDVTRRSVEETAASIIKIFEIKKNK